MKLCRIAVASFALVVCLAPTVLRADWFVKTNGNEVAAGTSWATAFKSLSNAVAHATTPGDTIYVTNGTHAIYTTLSITNGITLVGVNGQAETIISVQLPAYGSIPGVNLTHSNAVMRGFTVTHSVNQFNYNQYGPVRLDDGIVEECLFTGNTNRSIGGIYMTGGVLRNSTITENRSSHWNTGWGGGVRMTGGTVTNCQIYGNRGADGGGGVAMWNGRVVDCVITNNFADRTTSGQGGGVYMNNGRIENCLVIDNRLSGSLAVKGGGVSMVNGDIVHCTIADNTRPGGDTGAGLYMTGGVVSNSIMYFNGTTFPAAGTENLNQVGGTVAYSCAQPVAAGTGNIGAGPDFVDRSGQDYHLAFGSACIDSGAYLVDVPRDLEQNSRPKDGDGAGGAQQDMGCYEADTAGATFACTFTGSPIVGTNVQQVIFTPSVVGPGTPGETYYWDFDDDGTIDVTTTGSAATNTYVAGTYSVTLHSTNTLSQGATKTRTDYIVIYPSTSYVASAGANIAPYDTWAKAAHDIQDAVDSVLSSGTVMLSNETHTITLKINVSRAMTITSLGTREDTVIKSPGSQRVMEITDPGVVLEKVTITGVSLSYPNNGAVSLAGGEVRDCIFTGNNLGGGGGIYMTDGFVHDCVITNNAAVHGNTGYGGGVYVLGGRVSNCVIRANRGNDGGGAVRVNGGVVQKCILSDSYSTRSTAKGGGIYMSGGRIENCVISSNYLSNALATLGGGVYIHSSGGAIVNSTICNNYRTGGDASAGVYMLAGVLSNSIAYYNSATFPATGLENINQVGGTVVYSCMQPLISATGNVDGDPNFINSGYDFHLQRPSSCIDSGTNPADIVDDIEGSARPQDGDGDSTFTHDMGAYESPTATAIFEVTFTASPVEGTNSLQSVFTAEVSGPGTSTVNYAWDWTLDGSYDLIGTSHRVATNFYAAPGSYSVQLRAINALNETALVTRLSYITVRAFEAYVSTNGSDTFPYDTWAKAADNVKDAIDAVAAPGNVYVSNGTYTVDFKSVVDNAKAIQSVSGADETVLDSSGIEIFDVNHAGAVIDGFTLRGVRQSYFHYGAAWLFDGTIRNCIFTDNILGSCGGVRVDGGLLYNCVITNNEASHQNTGFGGGVQMSGGVVSNCTILDNIADDAGGGISMTGGTVIDCTISGNIKNGLNTGETRAGAGVRMTAGELINCVIQSNVMQRATTFGGGGLYMSSGLTRGCLLTGNACTNLGAGVYLKGGLLESSTLSANVSVSGNGGGLYMVGGAVTNSIIYGNTAAISGDDLEGTVTNIFYSCSPALTDGVDGNVTGNPLFASAGSGNYRLLKASPCVDSGDDHVWMIGSVDLDGADRILSKGVDMGAYETFVPPAGSVMWVR